MTSASTWSLRCKDAIGIPSLRPRPPPPTHLFLLPLLALSGFLVSISSAATKVRMQIYSAQFIRHAPNMPGEPVTPPPARALSALPASKLKLTSPPSSSGGAGRRVMGHTSQAINGTNCLPRKWGHAREGRENWGSMPCGSPGGCVTSDPLRTEMSSAVIGPLSSLVLTFRGAGAQREQFSQPHSRQPCLSLQART